MVGGGGRRKRRNGEGVSCGGGRERWSEAMGGEKTKREMNYSQSCPCQHWNALQEYKQIPTENVVGVPSVQPYALIT